MRAVRIMRDELDGRAGTMTLALTRSLLKSRSGTKHAISYEPRNREDRRFVNRHDERAQEYRGMNFIEIAAECIGHRGNIYDRQKFDILTRAFESTSDFPSIFENVLNKSLLARYELAIPTYRKIAEERPRTHPDSKNCMPLDDAAEQEPKEDEKINDQPAINSAHFQRYDRGGPYTVPVPRNTIQ